MLITPPRRRFVELAVKETRRRSLWRSHNAPSEHSSQQCDATTCYIDAGIRSLGKNGSCPYPVSSLSTVRDLRAQIDCCGPLCISHSVIDTMRTRAVCEVRRRAAALVLALSRRRRACLQSDWLCSRELCDHDFDTANKSGTETRAAETQERIRRSTSKCFYISSSFRFISQVPTALEK